MIKIKKPIYWESFNFFSLLLFPLSLITIIYNLLKIFKKKKKFKIKTICVGNIYIGGTGKTPLVLKINELLKNKYKTIFIKKKYPDQIDEQNLLAKYGKLKCSKYRENALKISERKKYELSILDDGLQDKSIFYDISIVCFNSSDLIGNGLVIPAGPLRETMSNISNYDVAFLNGENKNKKFEIYLKKLNPDLKIFNAKYYPRNLRSFKLNKNFLMFSGIGNSLEFEKTLKKYKFKIKKTISFPDHYNFTDFDIKKIKKIAKQKKLEIITTEKDYYRLSSSNKKNIKYLKIYLKIKNEENFKKFLIKTL